MYVNRLIMRVTQVRYNVFIDVIRYDCHHRHQIVLSILLAAFLNLCRYKNQVLIHAFASLINLLYLLFLILNQFDLAYFDYLYFYSHYIAPYGD